MSALRPEFYISSNVRAVNQGGSVPPWYSNVNNKSSWYSGKPEYDYYFYNMVDNGSTETNVNYTVYIQYGHNSTGWATAKFFVYRIQGVVTYSGTQRDKIVAATITLVNFWSRQTDYVVGGVSVKWTIRAFDSVVATFSGNTASEFTLNPNESRTQNIVIPYLGSTVQTALGLAVEYPNGEFNNTYSTVGLRLYNDREPLYYPHAYRNFNNNSRYTSFNDLPVLTHRMKIGNTWVVFGTMEYVNQNTIGNGNIRYRNGSSLRQVPLVDSRS